ncbi:outer membrane protein [Legionella maioricensis]|uniref:Outer membrane beta-barrel protein n=1 Tax=Legionella maioricensis TaxID=2896528 RepID=A0A9X2CZ77_9GAMM|nr:outer membrane beta-barrel protein [Legionella maioricensis]MCL9683022.1 outer membrane beta-barrel protein [Legionella maioricensis]MCL9686370.1 outer membrane beta-barrel protein [Legionella maioricensis]
MYRNMGKKLSSLILILCSGLDVQTVLAGNQHNNHHTLLKDNEHLSAYVITLSAGPVWTEGGETQTFFLQPDVEKTYTADNSLPALAEGALFLGIQRALNTRIQGQLGVELAAASNARLSGDIWDDADPVFDNYTYRYHIQHSHIALKGKLLMNTGHIVLPYISGSIGIGSNQARAFIITPKNSAAVPTPAFLSHTESGFTYTAGAGIQKALSEHWHAGVGYEFADWGKNNLAPAPGQTMGQGLTLDHIYTHQLQFSLSYTV